MINAVDSLTIRSYPEAIAFLEGLDVSAMKLGLERIERLLETLGNPQDALPMVHIAGTNGKGSTTAMLTAILGAVGYSVGSFTSPHLIDLRERICLNGVMIPKEDFWEEVASLAQHLIALNWPRAEWPTYFEFLNVIAYRYFARKRVDVTVFEVGLGGRLDSTNVVKHPNVTAITTISLDHMERLGGTLEAIAFEKAGILKPGIPLVLGGLIPDEARAVIHQKAMAVQAPLLEAQSSHLIDKGLQAKGYQEIWDRNRQCSWDLSLIAPYQKENLATVLAIIEQLQKQGFTIPDSAIAKGLRETQWPGRFQYLTAARLIIDGSHNPEGFQSLRVALEAYFKERPLYWIVSLRANREPLNLLQLIEAFPTTQGVVWTRGGKEFLYHTPAKMVAASEQYHRGRYWVKDMESPQEALAWMKEALAHDPQALGIATGSLYTAGELLRNIEEVVP